MYQDYDGQWVDESGYGGPPPPTVQMGGITPGNISHGPMPSGVPDPNNPGYDTAGYVLGASADASGHVTVPNQQTGLTSDFRAGDWYDTLRTAPMANAEPGGGDSSGSGDPSLFQSTYQVPSPYQFTPFSYDSYTPLTADQAAAEPGYAFARDQGRNAIETAAASRGNVLSGAHLKDLFAWGDQFAGQNYQNAEARNEGIYNINRGNAYNNWLGNTTQGLAAWQANLQPGQFGATLGTNQGGLKLNALTGIANAGAA